MRNLITALVFGLLVNISLTMGQTQPAQSFRAALDTRTVPADSAKFVWANALTHCGDSYFFVKESPGTKLLVEYKEPIQYEAQFRQLNRADQLNGLQASGQVLFNASA